MMTIELTKATKSPTSYETKLKPPNLITKYENLKINTKAKKLVKNAKSNFTTTKVIKIKLIQVH